MAKHYLKFSSGAADRARQLFSNEIDPLQSAFEDLTARGQRIRFRPHPPTESGPCIELLGTRSSALVGADRRQQGVLFAFHFREPAVTDSASAQAADYPASFRLWQSNAEPGDSVAPLFTSAPSASAPRPPASPQQRARSAPSAVLRAYLGGVPRDIRTRYWPVVASMTFPAEEIAAAVRAWRRHGLDALSLPTKGSWQESVLRGSASVATTRSNADAIWPLFDVLLLERFAVFLQDIPAGETRFHALLQDIAELPIPDPQRARLWLHLVLPRDADTLVSDVASFVSTLRRLSPSAQRVWERHIDDAVRELAPRFPAHEQLEVLRQRVDLADAQDVPIADALADWAGLASTTVASNVAPPLAPPATTSGSWKALSNDAQIPTVAMDADASSDAPLLDQWVLATLGSGEDVVRTLRRATGDIVSLLKAVEEEPSSTKVLLTLSEHAEAIQLTINEWRVLPPAERISRQMNSCADAYARAKGDVPLSMLHQLMSRGIEPDAVVEIADLCKHRDIWKAMPRWWWTRIPGTGTPDPIDQEAEPWMAAFADPAHRRLARFGLKLISENELAKANLELLEAIPPPEHGIDPDRHLESKLHELTEAQVAVRRIEERLPAFVPLGQALPQQDFIELAERFANLSDWLSKGCAEAIACELVKAPSAAPSRLSAFEKKLGTLQGLGLSKELLRAMSFEEMRKGIELIGSEGDASPPIEFSHALVPSEGGGNRAPRVAFRPFDDDAAFGTVAVPITLRAQAPASTRLALQYANVTDPQLGQWPLPLQERADVGPRELHLLEGDWTRAPGQDRWQYTFIGHIPVRRPATGDSVTLMVTAVDAVSAQVVGRSKQLQWTIAHVPAAGPGDARPDIPLQWSEGINLEYARNHPVGPQKQSARLLDKIRAGDSFAVVAPRRFGKSTLIEHIQGLLGSDTLTTTLVCADFRAPGTHRIDHHRLWGQLAERLPSLVPDRMPHVALRFDGGSPPLPVPECFDALRRALADSDKAGLVVFFDEAHLLFAGGSPVEYSSRMRTLLSTRLSRREGGRAPLMFGFFGVPTMSSARLGELGPYLNPVSDHSLDADELHRLARQFTNGRLEMTRDARERIVAISSNLLILQRVLRRVRDHVQDRFRTWVIRQDVIEVEEQFKRELLRGDDPESVRRYLLDVLNDSVDLEQWRPSTSYPLALALAVAHRDKFRGDEAVRWAVEVLANWASVLLAGRSCLPKFDDTASTGEHLQTLAELGVYRGGRFSSEFLECALAGSVDTQQMPVDPEVEEALMRAGVPSIQLPPDLTLVGRGGQAEVFRTPDKALAVRSVPIETNAERTRFLERLSLFDVIRTLQRGNDPRVAHIMHLRDVGLAAVNGVTSAVQTYDWIDGSSLEDRRRTTPLGGRAAVRIGHQIAGALAALHENGVWHRDVCPRNVVLKEDQLLAVLIDFGFATFSNRGRTAIIESDEPFPAPEIRQNPPQWSAAADVYSLAKTIESLLDPMEKDTPTVLRAIAPFMTDRATARGSLTGLLSSLERLELELNVRRDANAFQERLLLLVKDESLSAILRRRTYELDGFALSLFPTPASRAAKVANLVNQVAEKKRQLSIGRWLRDTFGPDRYPDELWIYVALRDVDAHGHLDLTGRFSPQHRRNPAPLLRQGAARLAEWLEIRELPTVVDFLMTADAGT